MKNHINYIMIHKEHANLYGYCQSQEFVLFFQLHNTFKNKRYLFLILYWEKKKKKPWTNQHCHLRQPVWNWLLMGRRTLFEW